MVKGMEMAKMTEKSSFSITCSLLTQYIKEKGNFSDLGLGMSPRVLDSSPLGKPETYRPLETMSLLPGVGVTDDDTKDTKSIEPFPQIAVVGLAKKDAKEPEKSQLTIFYGGKVLVFDKFPAEKAKDLMQLASKGQKFISGTTSMVSSGADTPVVDAQISLRTAKPPMIFPAQAQPNFSDLPIARKASLHRFLEKRKDRINAKAPYQTSGNNSGSKDLVPERGDQPAMAGLGAACVAPWIEHELQQMKL